jgi:hypothetical protein
MQQAPASSGQQALQQALIPPSSWAVMGHLVPTRASFRSFGSPSSKQRTSAADHAKERRKASNTSHRRGGDVAQPPLRLSYLCKKCMPCPGHASRNVRTPRRRWFSRILAFGRMAAWAPFACDPIWYPICYPTRRTEVSDLSERSAWPASYSGVGVWAAGGT